jgi:hypothetical protein
MSLMSPESAVSQLTLSERAGPRLVRGFVVLGPPRRIGVLRCDPHGTSVAFAAVDEGWLSAGTFSDVGHGHGLVVDARKHLVRVLFAQFAHAADSISSAVPSTTRDHLGAWLLACASDGRTASHDRRGTGGCGGCEGVGASLREGTSSGRSPRGCFAVRSHCRFLDFFGCRFDIPLGAEPLPECLVELVHRFDLADDLGWPVAEDLHLVGEGRGCFG